MPLFLEWAPEAIWTEEVQAPIVEELQPQAPEVADADIPTQSIVAKNLNYATTEATLKQTFEKVSRFSFSISQFKVGPVRSVKIARSKDSKGVSKSLGFAFVEFADHESMLKAIKSMQVRKVRGFPSYYGTGYYC